MKVNAVYFHLKFMHLERDWTDSARH